MSLGETNLFLSLLDVGTSYKMFGGQFNVFLVLIKSLYIQWGI